MISLQAAVNNVALATKPPKHMRTKGKKSLAKVFNDERFLVACEKYKADPLDVLARVISDAHCGDVALEKRAEIALRSLKFLMPEKKAVEHTGKDGEPVRFIIES